MVMGHSQGNCAQAIYPFAQTDCMFGICKLDLQSPYSIAWSSCIVSVCTCLKGSIREQTAQLLLL